MEWREAIGEAKDAADTIELDHLGGKLRKAMHQLQEDLAQHLDQQHDYASAAEIVRKLRFFDKLREEINDALEALEA
jgi:molecular chaperone HscB